MHSNNPQNKFIASGSNNDLNQRAIPGNGQQNVGNAFGINPALMRNMFPMPNVNMNNNMRGIPLGSRIPPGGMNMMGMNSGAGERGVPFFPNNAANRNQNPMQMGGNRPANVGNVHNGVPGQMVIPTLPPSMAKRLQDFPQAANKASGTVQPSANTIMSPIEHASLVQPGLASAQRKKNRPLDKYLPKSVQTLIPESKTYNELLEMEKRVDVLLSRKRLDFTDASRQPKEQQRTLRVYISNFAGDQNSVEVGASEVPNWTLRVEGRVLEQGIKRPTGPPLPKFSSFLRSLVVEIDKPDAPESSQEYTEVIDVSSTKPIVVEESEGDAMDTSTGNDASDKPFAAVNPSGTIEKTELVEWHNTRNAPDTDGFEIKRPGSDNVSCRIFLYLSRQPEEYKLSDPLRAIVGLVEATKHRVLAALWEYVKRESLASSEDRRSISKNAALQKLFGTHEGPTFTFLELPALINEHLLPLDPIEIPYTISVEHNFHVHPVAYDIDVSIVDTQSREPFDKFAMGNPATQQQVFSVDKAISDLISQLNHSRLRRDFMLEFSKDPVGFIKTWLASQTRDLETLMGEHRLATKEIQSAGFYKQGWVQEAVLHYLNSLGK